jgi:hypothetical protein
LPAEVRFTADFALSELQPDAMLGKEIGHKPALKQIERSQPETFQASLTVTDPGKARTADFRQQAYGLRIVTDVPLPELARLQVSARGPTVRAILGHRFQRIRLNPRWYLRSRPPGGRIWLRYGKTADGYVLSFPNLADFIVDSSGSQVVCCNASSDISLETIRHLLIDQVLALIVNLRGREAIHATAVATRNGVCAFTGLAGSGKSTLAASFVLAGYPLVCDDCLALCEGKAITAIPGYPGLRLWDDSIRALGASSRNLKPVAHYTTKSRLKNHSRRTEFCSTPRRLARIYILKRARSSKRSSGVVIEDLAPADALMGLVEAAYRFDITDRAMLTRQFQFLSRVAERVAVKRLMVPNEFSALSSVREAVIHDLQG